MEANNKIQEKYVDVDVVLNSFSIFDRYYLYSMILLFLSGVCSKFTSTNFVIVAATVGYSCKDDENATCSTFNRTHSCSEWIYEDPNSIVAEFDLACEDWKRALIGTIHSAGYMVGLLVVGLISDKLGRKAAVIITTMSFGVAGVAKSFSPNFWLYIALEFYEAFMGGVFSPLFMLAVEMVSTKNRVPFISLFSMGFPVGGVIAAAVAWRVPYWRTYLQWTYSSAFLFITYIFLIDESPRWYLANGRKEEAIAIIEKISKRSKIDVDKDILQMITYKKDITLSLTAALRDTFTSKILLTRFVILIFLWVSSMFIYYGMTINSVSLPGNKYLNIALVYFMEIPGLIINMYILKKFQRKHALSGYFLVGAVLCLIQPFIFTDSWVSIALYMIGKVMATLFTEATYIFTSELFPTHIRNSMHGFLSSIGRIGSLVAPQTPLLLVYWKGLPALVFGGVAFIAGLLTFLAPDTSNSTLPDSIEQAEKIGRK